MTYVEHEIQQDDQFENTIKNGRDDYKLMNSH